MQNDPIGFLWTDECAGIVRKLGQEKIQPSISGQWGMGKNVKGEGIYVYLWLTRVVCCMAETNTKL